MNNTNNSFELHGSNKEKAQQLIDKMKEKTLSIELLDAILPHEQEFFKSFVEIFRIEADKEAKGHEIYMKSMDNAMANLAGIIPNENIDSETRHDIIELISQIGQNISDVQKKQISESGKTQRWGWGIAIGGVLLITAILVFVSRKNNGSMGNTIH